MSTTISIDFTTDKTEFLEKFQSHSEIFSILLINIAPSVIKCLELLSYDWFKSFVSTKQNLQGLIFRTDEKIDENFNEKPNIFDYSSTSSIFIAFQSTSFGHECVTYWKVPSGEKFYSLFIDSDETEGIAGFFHEFILDEFKSGSSGILEQFQKNTKLRLKHIGDKSSRNLLQLAVSKKRPCVIRKLLEREFDPDTVIDQAWTAYIVSNDDDSNRVIMELLRANSKFPENFDYEAASMDVKKFVEFCESLRRDIDQNDMKEMGRKFDEEPNLVYFYDRNSQSLLAYALKHQKFKILNFLHRGLSTGCHEDLDDVYETLGRADFRLLRNRHQMNAKEFKEVHLLTLRMRSRIGNNDQFAHQRWELLEEAFVTINSHPYCSKILKIAAECKKLKIFFDFKHDSAYYMDPATSIYTKGIIYEGGTIYIGAKYMTDEKRKFEVFGVIAHELCHLSTYVTFMNRDFDPFPMGESSLRTRFIEQVMSECWEKREAENIVKNVFDSYSKSIQESEMIVTVPQILMHYYGNDEKIKELEETFVELFKYSKEIVEPELDRSLSVLKVLEDEEKSVSFRIMTEPMKAKLLHSKIKFQGQATTFSEIIGSDAKILEFLPSESIKNVLMKNEVLEIGHICELNLKYGVIEPGFRDQSFWPLQASEEQTEEDIKNFDEIHTEVESSKVFLFADHAGTGKTTTFKIISRRLKEQNKTFWISFINLRTYTKVFEKFLKKIEELKQNSEAQNLQSTSTKYSSYLSLEDITSILTQISCESSSKNHNLELKIFSKLFSEGKAVLLFDGVDEVCPKYTHILMDVFYILNQETTKNQLWISTRPHYADKITQVIPSSAPKYASYRKQDIKDFIRRILKANGINDEEKLEESVAALYHMISGYLDINKSYPFKNNPLMIMLLTELDVESDFKMNIYNSLYIIFTSIVDKQRKLLGEKVPTDDRDRILKFNVWDIHHVMALTVIIINNSEEVLGFKLTDLAIMKKWKREKKKWTSDMIQRYGFVSVDIDDPDSSIDFSHRTFAEYFVAQFVLTFIFDDHTGTSEEEIKKVFKLLDLMLEDEFNIVREFIVTCATREGKKMEFDEAIVEIFIENIPKIHKDVLKSQTEELDIKFEYYPMFGASSDADFDERIGKLLALAMADFPEEIKRYQSRNKVKKFEAYESLSRIDDEISRKFWGMDEGCNVLVEIAMVFGGVNFKYIIHLVELRFGMNWHEKFNKSGQNLMTDEELDNLKGEVIDDFYWVTEKSLIKFISLIHKNLPVDEVKKVYKNLQLSRIENSFVAKQIVNLLHDTLDEHDFICRCLKDINFRKISVDYLEFIIEKIEDTLGNDREAMRKYLFEEHKEYDPLLSQIFYTDDLDIFIAIIKIYEKYQNSSTEQKNIILSCNILQILTMVSCTYYEEYKRFIQSIFGTDTTGIVEKIVEYGYDLVEQRTSYLKDSSYDNFKDFVLYVYGKDEKSAKKLIEKDVMHEGIEDAQQESCLAKY